VGHVTINKRLIPRDKLLGSHTGQEQAFNAYEVHDQLADL
jgi:hypothetical protein